MRRLARAHALLFILLFAGMGTVAPVADALLFHHSAAGSLTHIESRDNPACHVERCAFPLVQATSAGAPAAATAVAAHLTVAGGALLLPPSASPRAPHPGARRSRAPPSLLA